MHYIFMDKLNFFESKEGQAPEKFTQIHLKDIEFDQQIIQL